MGGLSGIIQHGHVPIRHDRQDHWPSSPSKVKIQHVVAVNAGEEEIPQFEGLREAST